MLSEGGGYSGRVRVGRGLQFNECKNIDWRRRGRQDQC